MTKPGQGKLTEVETSQANHDRIERKKKHFGFVPTAPLPSPLKPLRSPPDHLVEYVEKKKTGGRNEEQGRTYIVVSLPSDNQNSLIFYSFADDQQRKGNINRVPGAQA